MKVKIHEKPTQKSNKRTYQSSDQIVNADLVKENKKTVWVKLADKNVIKRDRSQIVES